MHNFEYIATESIDEACELLVQYGEDARVIAGGQSLLILLKQKLIEPSYVIDIKGVSDMDFIRFDEEDGLRIGALTTHRSVEVSPVIWEKCSVLAEAESNLASIQVRNWGTVAGNLCLGDPASDIMPPLMALGATVELKSKEGTREVGLADFFIDYYETALSTDEILTEIKVPVPKPNTGTSYSAFRVTKKDRPVVGVCASVTVNSAEEGVVEDVSIALGAAAPTAIRAKRSEELLAGERWNEKLVKEAALLAAEDSEPISDVSASEEYKRHLVEVLVEENLKKAFERAKRPGN